MRVHCLQCRLDEPSARVLVQIGQGFGESNIDGFQIVIRACARFCFVLASVGASCGFMTVSVFVHDHEGSSFHVCGSACGYAPRAKK